MLYPPSNAAADLAIDQHTCILPLHKRTQGPITALHLFGGAWGVGREVISGAIEIDFDTARSYSLSHRCPLISAGEGNVLPPLALASFPSFVLTLWTQHGMRLLLYGHLRL